MEINKLFESELKILNLIWDNEPVAAKELSLIASDSIGWNKNTTYTMLKKLIKKGYISRSEPNFIVCSIFSKENFQMVETSNLVNNLFEGSKKAFFSALLNSENLSKSEIIEILDIIESKR